jgi:hypothetical protein
MSSIDIGYSNPEQVEQCRATLPRMDYSHRYSSSRGADKARRGLQPFWTEYFFGAKTSKGFAVTDRDSH